MVAKRKNRFVASVQSSFHIYFSFLVVKGFYIDDRPRWKVTSKVFLIIQQSSVTVTKTVLVVRPNIGRRYRGAVQTRRYIQDNYKFCGNKQMLQRALALWEKEFNLANIASDSQYQFSCPGRLSETMIFTGHIAPVLMSIVAILNKGKSLDSKYFKLPTVVRAETGRSNEDSDDAEGRSTLLAGIPILSTEQDDCRAAMEERYEVAFHGKIPAYIVGLEIPASIDDSDEDGKGLVELLAERMEKKGVETARQVFNLVEAEKHQASIPGVTGKKLKVCL